MAKAQQQETQTTLLTQKWEASCRKLAGLADALPAEKFETRTVAGARTPGEVLRHVAFWNQYVADSLRGKPADDTANELPAAEYRTKAKILEALNRTAADAAAALREAPEPLPLKSAELVVSFLEHTAEHYGQLVAYARLSGIVPPASRT